MNFLFKYLKVKYIALIFILTMFFADSYSEDSVNKNLIKHGAFHGTVNNNLPDGWSAKSPRPGIMPKFSAIEENGGKILYADGNGNPDCVGYVFTPFEIEAGKSYSFHVKFKIAGNINPVNNLNFEIAAGNGSYRIYEYSENQNGDIEGEANFSIQGEGKIKAEARIYYYLCADGKLYVNEISLLETKPVPPRWVRIACVQGPDKLEDYGLKTFEKALDIAGKEKADLILLPEYMNGESVKETMDGPSVKLLSEKSKQYGMYAAGTIELFEEKKDRIYNAALLFDRSGKIIGRYDKIHLYGPELFEEGVTPGENVPVFTADFGRLAFITCADSWFNDVAELASLQNADILLFPNLGYDREIMHARALDNAVNIVVSSRSGNYGVWDSGGNDILKKMETEKSSSAFKDLKLEKTSEGLKIAIVTINLNASQTLGSKSYPLRTRKFAGNQKVFLDEKIQKEKQRWNIE